MIDTTKANQMKALNDKGFSQAKIARVYGISRERVRQILSNLKKVSHDQTS